MTLTAPLLKVENLSKRFPVGVKRGKHVSLLHAVDQVSFDIAAGESVGLVGESGCGKSTLTRVLARLIDPTDGAIHFDGKRIDTVPAKRFATAPERGRIQMVFQDPTDSLNPRFTAQDTIGEPLMRLIGLRDATQIRARVSELAAQVGLDGALLGRFPHQLSGGQKARVGIARAIATHPQLLILDEPTSALDVSVQAIILRLLADLRSRMGMSYLFVSHDLNVVRMLCDRVIVMYLGKIVEFGPAAEVFTHPRHPYTQALVSAIPKGSNSDSAGSHPVRIPLDGEPRSPIDPDPKVCRFSGRCSLERSRDRCTSELPLLRLVAEEHFAACHFAQAPSTA